jgi:glucose/arabinose dehydrogenase
MASVPSSPRVPLCSRLIPASLLVFTLSAGVQARAQGPPITLEPVITGLASPVYVTHAGDDSGRLFVVEQGGTIRVRQPTGGAATVFLDIRGRVLSGGERGLLGLAFHPDYETNRRFFVDYTRQPDGATVIAEYHVSAADPDVADPTEIVLLTIGQPFANHNGGMLEFGPDGDLYIGMGDGGSADDPGDRAQDVNELLGKILRIDVDRPASQTQLYSSPADNPFAGATPGRDEIYALGLRNPWRFSFDRQTGQLTAGDVGQGAREEVDLIVRGGNYGWRTFEGTLCTGNDPPPCDPSPFIAPIAEYGHDGARCSITGGYVYRGAAGSLPDGTYLFGDYCSGELFLLQGGPFAAVAVTGFPISSFGQDQDGELYVVDHTGSVQHVMENPCAGMSIAPPGLSLPVAGGSGVVHVTAAARCGWTASPSSPWIHIVSGEAGRGSGAVSYEADANPGPRSRTGTVRINGLIHLVSEAAPPRCVVEVEPKRIVAGPPGATGALLVTSRGGDCAWTATSEVPWIVITSGATGAGSGALQYRVDPNQGGTPRRGRIRIGSRATVTVRQP